MTTTTPQIFGQALPVALVQTNLLTVPNGEQAQINMFVCNQSSSYDYFSIELIPSGDNPDPARFVAFNTPVLPNGVFSMAGISLNSGDAVVVSTTQGNCSFTATGMGITN